MGSPAYRNLGSWETVASRNWLSQELQVATSGVGWCLWPPHLVGAAGAFGAAPNAVAVKRRHT